MRCVLVAMTTVALGALATMACGEVLPADEEAPDSSDAAADADGGLSLDVKAVDGGSNDGAFAVHAALSFTGVADAGAPSGLATFDAAEKFAEVVIAGGLRGNHSVEVWDSATCAALSQVLFAYVGTLVVEDAGSATSTFFSEQDRLQLLGKVVVFREADGRVSACGLVVR